MKIVNLRTNHLTNPLGYAMDKPVFTWTVEEATGTRQKSARVQVSLSEDFSDCLYDSKDREGISSLGFIPEITLKEQTRYYWRVQVQGENEETGISEAAWFETGLKEFKTGKWITSSKDISTCPLFYRKFTIPKGIKAARLYITGLGAYNFYLNGAAQEEILTPFYNDYRNWIQYQTYDITSHLKQGENALAILMGKAWYMGRFGFIDKLDKLYGDDFLLLGELHITMEDGSSMVVGTDTTWLYGTSHIGENSIYDGELYDARLERKDWNTEYLNTEGFCNALEAEPPRAKVMERLSPSLKVMERIKPKGLIYTKAGELVIDFGQEVTGYAEVNISLPEGARLFLQYGEILQEGNFYNENLRTAKQEYTYISDGKARVLRPHFTFYGFRYVKVEGQEEIHLEDYTACVVYSELDKTGNITTSDAKINRLFQNTQWGMKGNFLDVPTDCPQRDERMGWTGDAQAFSATACFHMYTPAFYRKYLYDMLLEQRELKGSVPHVVPDILGQIQRISGKEEITDNGSCAWGDAATVIPWNLYLYYGDKDLLEKQYENMILWVGYMKNQDETLCNGERLWKCGFHFADWLALDNPDKESSFGGTDPYYVASAHYYYSTLLTAKAAKVLGKEKDYEELTRLAEEIKTAIQNEYFTKTGRIAVDTQTAMVLALHWKLVPEEHKERLVGDLKKKLEENKLHLTTGFVGTQFLCPVLSDNGLIEYAYTLLFNEDYPSWLYEVNMGATTIWERWNSVLPNGYISDTGMNSLNHYAYGSIAEWMYRYMCGFQLLESNAGFKKIRLAPKPDKRLQLVKASYQSAAGLYESEWEYQGNQIDFKVKVPFDALAEFVLPEGFRLLEVMKEGSRNYDSNLELTAGRYIIKAESISL